MRDWIVVTTEDKSGSGLRLGIARPVGDSLATLRRTAARNAGLGLLFIAHRARRHRAAVGATHAQSEQRSARRSAASRRATTTRACR